MSRLFSNVRGDFFGGVTTSVVALPLAIAFGVSAFAPLGPEYVAQGALAGLYASIIAGALASFFGGTPTQISGPTAPMSVTVTAVLVRAMSDPKLVDVGASPAETALLIVAVTIFLGGIFQILLGLLGGGRLIKYIPYPVIAGFMNGIAVIIFMAQLRPLLGVDKGTRLEELLSGDVAVQPVALAVGLFTVAVTLVAPRFIRAVPGALIGLVSGVGLYLLLGRLARPELLRLEGNGLIIGEIPRAVPSPDQLFSFFRLAGEIPAAAWWLVLPPAMTLSVLAAIDTLLTSLVADMASNTKHDSRRELIGQGIGNIGSSFFGGLPAAGSTPVTMVNVNNGGRTPLSGIFKSAALLLIVLVLGGLVQWIPLAVLGGILAVTAFTMIDRESLGLVRKRTAAENLLVVLAVSIVTVAVDLIAAVGIGLAVACVLFVKGEVSRTLVRRRYTASHVRSKRVRQIDSIAWLEENGDRVVVYELSGSLFFGTCDKLLSEVESDLDKSVMVLDLRRVERIDLSGARLLRQLVDQAKERGCVLLLSHLQPGGDLDSQRLWGFLEEVGVFEAVGLEHVFADTDRALEWAENTLLEEMAPGRSRVEGTLEAHELEVFSDLSEEQVDAALPFLHVRRFGAGDVIFREGEPGDGMHFILGGRVSVLGEQTAGSDHRIATFGRGVFFGDMAVLEQLPRSATVRAETETSTLFLGSDDFDRLTAEEPGIASQLLVALARELSYRLRSTTREVRVLEEA